MSMSRNSASSSATSLAAECDFAAAAVLAARSELGHACRYSGSADAIAAARQKLVAAKVARLAADHAFMSLSLPPDRQRLLITSDIDLEARPNKADHDALDEAQRTAVKEFIASHPRDPDPDDGKPCWPKATRAAYDALLDAFRASHVALGCDLLAPCRISR